jgi:hypothetical protein
VVALRKSLEDLLDKRIVDGLGLRRRSNGPFLFQAFLRQKLVKG